MNYQEMNPLFSHLETDGKDEKFKMEELKKEKKPALPNLPGIPVIQGL